MTNNSGQLLAVARSQQKQIPRSARDDKTVVSGQLSVVSKNRTTDQLATDH